MSASVRSRRYQHRDSGLGQRQLLRLRPRRRRPGKGQTGQLWRRAAELDADRQEDVQLHLRHRRQGVQNFTTVDSLSKS